MKKTKFQSIKLKTGNVVTHKKTDSRWIIVGIEKNSYSKPMTLSVSGYCLYTGKTDYWTVGNLDTWIVDIDANGNAHYFAKMFDVEQD